MTREELPLHVVLRGSCFCLSGEFRGDDARTASAELERLTMQNASATIDVDLSEITFVDSVGLRELLRLRRLLPALRFVAISPLVQRRIDLTGTTGLILGAGSP